MTHIAHLTDLHFGADDALVVDALVADLNDDRPDLVAISGDLTQGGHHAEFRSARQFMDRLLAPKLAVPGNHDITPYNLFERFTDPYARWREEIDTETEPFWTDGTVAVIGLNTARRFSLNWDWSRGRVTGRRLLRLIGRLEQVPEGVVRVIVAHHPLLPPEMAPDTPVAGGAARALEALRRHQVALVLAGHLHRGYVRLATVGGEWPLVVQGGTATSVRLRGEPNSYNRLRVDAGGKVAIEVRIWDGKRWISREAAPSDVLSFTRGMRAEVSEDPGLTARDGGPDRPAAT